MNSFQAHDGLSIAARFEQGDPRLVFAHATGFCKETWDPIIDLFDAPGVLAIDQRGHGDSEVADPPFDWWDLGRDIVTGMGTVGWDTAIGVGHSSGAASLVIAELIRPGTFTALVLIEPIIFPPPYMRYEALPLAVAAERRRSRFPSLEAVRSHYRGRGPFTRWTDAALEAYLRGGFRQESGEYVLKCLPEVEAECYRAATLHAAWERLGEVACPAVVVGGEDSDTHPGVFLEEQAGRLGNATAEVLAGATHFVPMEKPESVAALIGRFLP